MSCCFMTWNTNSYQMLDVMKRSDDAWYSIWYFTDEPTQKDYTEITGTWSGDTGSGWGTSYYANGSVCSSGQFTATWKAKTSYNAWLQGKFPDSPYTPTINQITARNFHFPWSSDDSRFAGGNRWAMEGILRSATHSLNLSKDVDSSFFNDESDEVSLTHWRYEAGKQYPEWTIKKCNPIYFYNYGDSTGINISCKASNVVDYSGSYTLGSFNMYSSSTMRYMPTYCTLELDISYFSSATKKKYLYFKTGSNYYFIRYINPGTSSTYSFRPADFGLTSGTAGYFIFRDAELVNQYTSGISSYQPNLMFNTITDEFIINSSNSTSTFTNGYYLNSYYIYPNSYSNIFDYTISDYASGFGIGLYKSYNSSSSDYWIYARDNYYERKPFMLYDQSITSSEYLLVPATSNPNANSTGTLFKDSSGNLVTISSFNFNNGKNYVTSSNSRTYYVLCPCWNFKNKCSTDITVKAFNWTVPKSDTGYAIPAKKTASIVITNNSTSTQKIYIDDVLITTLAAGESHTETKTPDPGKVVVIRNEVLSTNKIRVNGEWKDAQAKVYVSGSWKNCTAYVYKDGAWHKTS